MQESRLKLKSQHGAVMIETAYVLPLVLGVMLFIVELVAYALNSFAVNDVLTDMHTSILSEVSAVSSLDAGGVLGFTPLYASCVANQVVLPEGNNAAIAQIVKSSLATKNITFLNSKPATATITKSVVSGFNVYIINFTGVANSLVLPEFFEVLLPINVNTIVSIKDSCV